jgi:hypothetical protein
MAEISGHKKTKGQKRPFFPWPRKQILKHTEGKCPYCSGHIKDIEQHIRDKHKLEAKEKPMPVKGAVHGHE